MTVAAAPGAGTVRWPWRYWTRQAAWAVVDLVFPPQCAGCQRPGQRFCSDCQAHCAPLAPPWCDLCGYPIERAGVCERCQTESPSLGALAGVRSAAFHAGPPREAVLRLKYHQDGILADSLARLLLAATPSAAPAGSRVMAVPLAPSRLAERGYNQAALLARAYAELSGRPLAAGGVCRVRDTQSQVGLSVPERHRNVAGAFAAEPRVAAGQTIILIDDVCTTGATLNACAMALRAAGAAQVWGLTLTRARRADEDWSRAADAAPGQAGAAL